MNQPLPPKTKTTTVPLDEVQQTLYAKRQKIYPRQVHGLFAKLKITSVLILLGMYYIFPWLQWNGQQMVLFDLPARQFHIFGLTFWPQDAIYLAFLLIIAAYALFFFTTLAGRLWCGFACPQTVWTETFLWIERLVEGDRPQQMKLDKAPMSARKLRLKATKHSLWILFSLLTGFTFVGYFTPIQVLSAEILSFSLGPWEAFWLFFYSFATYGNAGWLREQVCIYMCPYARFQSAMFDADTLIVAYNEARGEPRGSRKRGADAKEKGLGDCIDCTLCVQVCPTGIDIRNGLQYQCISCSACIDVCNDVMDKMNYPKGLISYTTENTLRHIPTHILRPRIWIYGALLVVFILTIAYSISQRVPLGMDVIRDRSSSLFREDREGMIENVYVLKVMNMDTQTHDYTVTATGIEGLELRIENTPIQAGSGAILDVPVTLKADPAKLKERSTEVHFVIEATDAPAIRVERKTRFLGPLRSH